MEKAEKTLHSFVVAEPTTGGPGYTVTLGGGATAPLFNLIDSQWGGNICNHLFKLAIHMASAQSAIIEASGDVLGDRTDFRIDPSMQEIYWTLDELYKFFAGLQIEFTGGAFR